MQPPIVPVIATVLGAAPLARASGPTPARPASGLEARLPPVRYQPAPWLDGESAERAHEDAPTHVGYDGFARVGGVQQVAARFSYEGHALEGERVQVFAWQGANWQALGEALTSRDDQRVVLPDGHVGDEGGLVTLRVPDAVRMPVGVHRIRFVVRGDGSWTDARLAVVDGSTRVVVSDVDGTLTDSETAAFFHRLGLRSEPRANPGAADALQALAAQGYDVFYLTGRGRDQIPNTRAWLASHGFPPGVLHTQDRARLIPSAGATTAFKVRELLALEALLGHPVDVGFGNTQVEVDAFRIANIPAGRRYFYRFNGNTQGGVRNTDYRALAIHRGAGSARNTL